MCYVLNTKKFIDVRFLLIMLTRAIKEQIVSAFLEIFRNLTDFFPPIQLQFRFDFVVPTHCSQDDIPCAFSKKLLSVDEEFTKVCVLKRLISLFSV